ncbi:MAG: peptidylprolyl isomerase [Firmicutes bacterium]|nr:peptidylprolyl isomerase [Bacillota bacterium]
MKKVSIILNDDRQIRLGIDTKKAPISADNFIKLCEQGYYEGLIFHRVIDKFMIQGGGFSIENNQLVQKDGVDTIKGEFDENGVENDIKHEPGVISMARTNIKNSATSQFFICVANCNFLDGKYAGFGKVLDNESLQVAIDISKVPTGHWMNHDDVPKTPIIIKKCIVE